MKYTQKLTKRFCALLLVLAVCAAMLAPAALAATAQLPTLGKTECVVDDAGVLSDSTAQSIQELNAQLESACEGAEIGVITVQYTGNLSTEEYATEAFNAWGIGDSSKNNGVLILLVMESDVYDDGDYYLTYGDGFRNTTLESQASAIAQTMEDAFAAQNYDEAVLTCAQNTANTIADIYGVSLSGSTGGSDGYYEQQTSHFSLAALIEGLIIGFIILVVVLDLFVGIGRLLGFGRPGWGPLFFFTPRRRRRGPPPPRDDFFDDYGRGPRGPRGPRGGGPGPGSFGGMGGGSFGGGHSGGGSWGGMGGGSSHGGGGGRGR